MRLLLLNAFPFKLVKQYDNNSNVKWYKFILLTQGEMNECKKKNEFNNDLLIAIIIAVQKDQDPYKLC